MVNEKYGLRVLEFNTRDINDWHHETPHSTDAGPWAAGACALALAQGGDIALLNVVTHGNIRSTASKSRC